MLSLKKDDNKDTSVKHITMDDLATILEEDTDYILLDVRTEEEYKEGHIKGAICIPNETIDESVTTKLPDKDKEILVYCRSGNRSKQAATKLNELGYTNITECGGIIDWKGEIEK